MARWPCAGAAAGTGTVITSAAAPRPPPVVSSRRVPATPVTQQQLAVDQANAQNSLASAAKEVALRRQGSRVAEAIVTSAARFA